MTRTKFSHDKTKLIRFDYVYLSGVLFDVLCKNPPAEKDSAVEWYTFLINSF